MIRIRQLALWLPVFDQLMTLTYSTPDSKSLSKKSDNVTAEDGKVNTTLPATSPENREIYVTVSSGKAEREVNDIMENRTNKRHEPIVVFIGHSDSEELGKDKSSELPKFTSLSFSGLHPEIRSSKRQENDDVMFLGDTDQYVSVDILDKIWPDTPLEFAAMGYYRVALHKTVPENRNTVTRLSLKVRRMKFLLHWEGILMKKLMPRN